MPMDIKPLSTAKATATGGRNGQTRAEDGSLSVNLSVPKEMGGPGKPGFGLAVKLLVGDPSLPQKELEELAREAHERICPYSPATRGNVEVALEVNGG
jgi:osmotically inducible protein OsmC